MAGTFFLYKIVLSARNPSNQHLLYVMPKSHFAECTANVDECKMFEIRAHSSLSKDQMHKIFVLIQLGMVKSKKIVRTLLSSN